MGDVNEDSAEVQGVDTDWERTMSAFQSVSGTPSLELTTAVKRGRAKLVRGWVIGVAILIGTSTLGLHRLAVERDLASAVFALIQVGVPAWILLFVWRSQRDTWEPKGQSTRAFLEIERARRLDFARRMRFLRVPVIPTMLGLTALWHALLIARTPALATLTLPAVLGFGGAYAILAGIFFYAGHKLRRFQREAEDLSRQIAELEP